MLPRGHVVGSLHSITHDQHKRSRACNLYQRYFLFPFLFIFLSKSFKIYLAVSPPCIHPKLFRDIHIFYINIISKHIP